MMNSYSRFASREVLQALLKVARGEEPAQLVIKNGKFLDVFNCEFVAGDIAIKDGVIVGIGEEYHGLKEVDAKGAYIVPGFIDAHLHIESTMLTPAQFQRVVLPRGTTTVIWDPHEIANVKGVAGLNWALASTEELLLDVFIMLSSCVPAVAEELGFETSGHNLSAADLLPFHAKARVLGLAEMMNFPGVLMGLSEVLDKLLAFQDRIIDGHCPLLRGKDLNAYVLAGIRTEHEATAYEEAKEKLRKGMALLIREGSSAANEEALLPLLNASTVSRLAFCSDDRNPHDLLEIGHLDYIVTKALKLGYPPEQVFSIAGHSAAEIFGLKDRGAIAPGYLADLVIVEPQGKWELGMAVQAVYKNGELVTAQSMAAQPAVGTEFIGKNVHIKFNNGELREEDLQLSAEAEKLVIGVRPGQILTDKLAAEAVTADLLKIAVFDRHKASGSFSVGLVHGFALQAGAVAITINHDSHNLMVVGATDAAMVSAVNRLVAIDGGIVVVDAAGKTHELPLAIGGLMSEMSAEETAARLDELKQVLRELGCKLADPILQLAFLALPVIPSLKITDQGLIDVDNFRKI